MVKNYFSFDTRKFEQKYSLYSDKFSNRFLTVFWKENKKLSRYFQGFYLLLAILLFWIDIPIDSKSIFLYICKLSFYLEWNVSHMFLSKNKTQHLLMVYLFYFVKPKLLPIFVPSQSSCSWPISNINSAHAASYKICFWNT